MSRHRQGARRRLFNAGVLSAAVAGLASWLVVAPQVANAAPLGGTWCRSANSQVTGWASAEPAGPPPTGTAASTTPPTSTAPGGDAGCAVSYQVDAQWGSGFLATVTITNRGTAPVDGWTVAFAFAGNQQIAGMWNGSYTQTGAAVRVRSALHNAVIPPGGSQHFGFQGTYRGDNTPVTAFTLIPTAG